MTVRRADRETLLHPRVGHLLPHGGNGPDDTVKRRERASSAILQELSLVVQESVREE
ncbi:hypothetical protein GCM10010255_62900 [Streptomyces coeruleofuscus]|uniref:Uncharacterized protein n=1 Tax=Streptomyces coeruleofuscus TaxID=66879 RepID=A0ABP5VZN6_9ACTN